VTPRGRVAPLMLSVLLLTATAACDEGRETMSNGPPVPEAAEGTLVDPFAEADLDRPPDGQDASLAEELFAIAREELGAEHYGGRWRVGDRFFVATTGDPEVLAGAITAALDDADVVVVRVTYSLAQLLTWQRLVEEAAFAAGSDVVVAVDEPLNQLRVGLERPGAVDLSFVPDDAYVVEPYTSFELPPARLHP